jgi:hypothetical protein
MAEQDRFQRKSNNIIIDRSIVGSKREKIILIAEVNTILKTNDLRIYVIKLVLSFDVSRKKQEPGKINKKIGERKLFT